MTSHANPQSLEDSPVFSISSRFNSPIIKSKISPIPFELTENTHPGSFVSYQTLATQLTSMSGTHEAFIKLSDESLIKIHEKMVKLRDDSDVNSIERPCQLEIPQMKTEDFDLDTGIPTLSWCAYCGCETATEVYYENSSKTFWSSVAIFFSGGVCGCFLLPYAMKSCKDVNVRCHRCKHRMSVGIV